MSQGNALIGFILLIGLAATVGWPWAAIAIVPFLLEVLIRQGPRRYVAWLRRQRPGQPVELAKASHGAGILGVGGFIAAVVHQEGGAISASPWLWVPFAAIGLWGALWLVTSGWQAWRYGPQGPTDTVVLVRSLVKIGVGGVIAHYQTFQAAQLLLVPLVSSDWSAVGYAFICLAGWLVAWWCLFTGTAKALLLVLVRVRFRRRYAPDPMQNPHGSARAATREESRRAGQGNKSALDDKRF